MLGAAQAIVTSPLARPDSRRPPFSSTCFGGPLLGFYLRDLTAVHQFVMLGGCILASTAAALPAGGLRSALNGDLADLQGSFRRNYSDAIHIAYLQGREDVIEMTSSAVTEFNWRFAAATLPAAEKAEIRRRLAQATDLLCNLIREVDRQTEA